MLLWQFNIPTAQCGHFQRRLHGLQASSSAHACKFDDYESDYIRVNKFATVGDIDSIGNQQSMCSDILLLQSNVIIR